MGWGRWERSDGGSSGGLGGGIWGSLGLGNGKGWGSGAGWDREHWGGAGMGALWEEEEDLGCLKGTGGGGRGDAGGVHSPVRAPRDSPGARSRVPPRAPTSSTSTWCPTPTMTWGGSRRWSSTSTEVGAPATAGGGTRHTQSLGRGGDVPKASDVPKATVAAAGTEVTPPRPLWGQR